MNPHRCKILCDKPFESSLCHRNDTTEHIATRRKAILPRRKVIRAMPSEPFVSTASYAVCPHPLRYGPALSYPTPRPVSFSSSPALPDGAQTVPATAARTNRLFPAAALRARTPYTRPEQEKTTGLRTPSPQIRTSPRAQTSSRTRNTAQTRNTGPNTKNLPEHKKPARKVRDPPDRRVRPGKNLYLSIPVIMKRPAPRAARGRPVVAHPKWLR